MIKFDYDAKYFDPEQTLDCGQIFRFFPSERGYTVISKDKACRVYRDGFKTVVESDDPDYFYSFFDLGRDYSRIVGAAKSFNVPLLTRSAEKFCGLRLLNQHSEEMIYSFIISQNNNIPRIKGIISRICDGLGEKFVFGGETFSAFPTTRALAEADVGFFKDAGCGYRDRYISLTAKKIAAEGIEKLAALDSRSLREELLSYPGIGGKVADCVSLFGFSKRDRFPVDTWLEKVYREDFGGTLSDREKISAYFASAFGENSGYIQQYLFYGKRKNL